MPELHLTLDKRKKMALKMNTQRKDFTVAWIKGQSGNPGGTPKGIREAAALAREHAPWAIGELKTLATSAGSEMARIRALEILLERGLGKPIQPIDTSASILELLEPADRESLLSAFEDDASSSSAGIGADAAGSC